MANCKCGKPATHIAYFPINAYAGLTQVTEPIPVCSYHAGKAEAKGFFVEVLKARDITFCEECGLGYPDSLESCPVCGTWKDD